MYTRLPLRVVLPEDYGRGPEGHSKSNSMDDILLTGRDYQEHLRMLDQVLQRWEKYGLRKRGKCKFSEKEVIFLAHKSGIHSIPQQIPISTGCIFRKQFL